MEEHHGREVGDEIVQVVRALGVEGGDHAKGGDHLELIVALEDVAQIGPLGADAQVVEHHIAVRVLELGALALGLERLLDGVEVLVTAGTLPRQTR